EKLRAEFQDKADFYGVNDEASSVVRGFVKKNNLETPVLLDGNRAVHRQYGITAIPTLLVIDPQGVIRSHFVGDRTEAALRQAIQAALPR
ncbi:MAG TPA: TlpA disulfide reductase family protein, partial [Bryobacteraceae bacterium]|nr:TlpA disulfide reductase family protein [Bryobacteraceae bacterium]